MYFGFYSLLIKTNDDDDDMVRRSKCLTVCDELHVRLWRTTNEINRVSSSSSSSPSLYRAAAAAGICRVETHSGADLGQNMSYVHVMSMWSLGHTSRTSPLQGHLTVLKVTVCHTAGHYGEEYDD